MMCASYSVLLKPKQELGGKRARRLFEQEQGTDVTLMVKELTLTGRQNLLEPCSLAFVLFVFEDL